MEPGETEPRPYRLGRAYRRRQDRAFAVLVFESLAKGRGDLRKIGEQNGRIEPEPLDGLKRDLDGVFGRIAELEHATRRRACPVVLRQIAASLTHQPDRRPFRALSGERTQKQFSRPGIHCRRTFSPVSEVWVSSVGSRCDLRACAHASLEMAQNARFRLATGLPLLSVEQT